MPIEASTVRNQFLATMATIVQKGGVSGADAMGEVAAQTAADIAKANPGIDSAELLASLPDVWKSDPKGHVANRQMNAFLQVAGPVLGVDDGVVSPLATRGVAAGRDVDAAIAINKARQAAENPSPALQEVIDITSASPGDIMKALDGALKDEGFVASIGGNRMGYLLRELGREMAGAIQDARPIDPNAPVVTAGGVPVAGPDIQRAAQERPFGTFRELATSQTTVGALATAAVHLAAIRAGLDETEMRSAMAGKDVQLMSGHAPPAEAMPLHVFVETDGAVRFGLGLEVAELRRFHDNPGATDEEVVKSVGGALRAEDAELRKYLEAEMPVGFFLDARAQKTSTVQTALADD